MKTKTIYIIDSTHIDFLQVAALTSLFFFYSFLASMSLLSVPQTIEWSHEPISESSVRSKSIIAPENIKPVAAAAKIEDPEAPKATSDSLAAAFDLIKGCESGHNYQAVNPNGYYGAYQFNQNTWNKNAQAAGRPDLVGQRPDTVSPADQDLVARELQSRRGWYPWSCAYHVGLL